MRYSPLQVDHLAAEYVLGTLQNAARRRFETLMTDRADVRLAVWRWERYLNGLASGLKPRRPPRRVWQNIQSRIGESQPVKTTFRQRWRGLWLAIPSAVVAAWLAVALLPVAGQDRMAIFSDSAAEVLWVISADLDNRVLQTESSHAEPSAIDKSYELWVLQSEGPPLSLGLLQIEPGAVEISISVELATALESAGSLAISLEPAGGSLTGLPTGPILYQAALVTI